MKMLHNRNVRFLAVALALVAGAASLFGAPIVGPETFAALGFLAVGNVEAVGLELKGLLEAQGKAFAEFKTANDARLAAIEAKGYAPADTVEKVDKLNAELDALAGKMRDYQAKAGRPPAGGGGGDLSPEAAEHKAGVLKMLRTGNDAGLKALEAKAMNSGSDPDGGYLIHAEMEREIDRVAGLTSALERIADVRTIGTSKWQTLVKKSGMAMRRVADGTGGGESTAPTFARIEIEAFSAEVEPWVHNETLEDAEINLEADLASEAGIAFAEGAAAEFINGNGVGKARGILGYDIVANASYAWGKVGYIASGASGAFAASNPADKLIDLQHALKSQYRAGAAWLMSDAVLAQVRQIKDGSGTFYLWQPDPAASFGGRLLGHPVEIDDSMPVLAANSYSIAFGNFKRGYTVVKRSGVSVIRDPYTTKGVTKFNFRRRFGGGN